MPYSRLDGETGGELKMTVAYYYLPSGRLVHKKKDATDWGVEPQINVPMDEATERAVAQARYEQELVRKPVAKLTTKPATTKIATTKSATTSPSTQPTAVDTQLKSAADLLRMFIILHGNSADFVNHATTKPVG